MLKISRFWFQSICGARLLTLVAFAFSLASAAVGLRWRPLSWKGSCFQVLQSWGRTGSQREPWTQAPKLINTPFQGAHTRGHLVGLRQRAQEGFLEAVAPLPRLKAP